MLPLLEAAYLIATAPFNCCLCGTSPGTDPGPVPGMKLFGTNSLLKALLQAKTSREIDDPVGWQA